MTKENIYETFFRSVNRNLEFSSDTNTVNIQLEQKNVMVKSQFCKKREPIHTFLRTIKFKGSNDVNDFDNQN